MVTTMKRCSWCTSDPLYISYHDKEWGVPSYDPIYLFEKLVLEGFQAGLSWITILRKRDHFRKVFFNFDPQQVAKLSGSQIDLLMQDTGIIRNRAKILSARSNAQAWLNLADPVDFMWSVTDGKPLIKHYKCSTEVPAQSNLSIKLSKQLKKAGFKFTGPVICHAYMQSTGMLMEHTTDCFRHKQLS